MNVHVLRNSFTLWLGAILGVVILILRSVVGLTPQYVEQFYARGLFRAVRWLFDNSLSLINMPLLLVFYVIMAVFVVKFIIFLFSKKIPLRVRLIDALRKVLNFSGYMVFLFMLLWGFNYARPRFTEQIGLKLEQLDTFALHQELMIAAAEAAAARDEITKNPMPINENNDSSTTVPSSMTMNNALETNIREDVSKYLKNYGFHADGHLRGRQIQPKGVLFRFGIAGIYMPFTGEASIDAGLHPLEKPFSMAHEMAHGYGWTDEATANFIAYNTCINSNNKRIRYSGYLNYFKYVANNYRRINPKSYTIFRQSLSEGMRNDIDDINKRILAYPTWFSTDKINDVFLKSQGITEGVESYAKIVVLVYSQRKNRY